MNKDSMANRLIFGLLLTLTVFAVSIILGNVLKLETGFIPSSFVTHMLMLALSLTLILCFKDKINYRIAFPKFKTVLKPILFGFLAAFVINIAIGILTVVFTGKTEAHPAVTNASFLQFLLFDFILASVAEEYLFRCFLQNYLRPLNTRGFKLFKRHISLPVLISALAFGFAHLVLIASGVGALFLIKMVLFTSAVGLIAGYYQEKYDNHAYAIIVHMAGNLMGLISILVR